MQCQQTNGQPASFFAQGGPQSTEAAAEEGTLHAASGQPGAIDPSSPRSQGSFNIFNLSPQDFSLSPLHRGQTDSQQVSQDPTSEALGP